jgi:hypothetical protein
MLPESSLPAYWFGPPPQLAADERWVTHLPANRSQGKRAVGGGLHVTNQRLLFSPNIIDAKLGGKPWSCPLSDIASVGIQRRRFSLLEMFSGGWVDRVRVDFHDGRRELFVVSNPAQRATELRELLHVPESAGELPTARLIR